MNKSDTFLSEEFKKQIAKPFERKSYKLKNSSTSTLEPISKEETTKSLRESIEIESQEESFF